MAQVFVVELLGLKGCFECCLSDVRLVGLCKGEETGRGDELCSGVGETWRCSSVDHLLRRTLSQLQVLVRNDLYVTWRKSYLGSVKPMDRLSLSNRFLVHIRLLFGIVCFDCEELIDSSVIYSA